MLHPTFVSFACCLRRDGQHTFSAILPRHHIRSASVLVHSMLRPLSDWTVILFLVDILEAGCFDPAAHCTLDVNWMIGLLLYWTPELVPCTKQGICWHGTVHGLHLDVELNLRLLVVLGETSGCWGLPVQSSHQVRGCRTPAYRIHRSVLC